MKKISKERMIAAIVTVLLVLSLIGTGLIYRSNGSLKSGLNDEKLKSESLLSEKLALAKEADKLKNDIRQWQGKSEESDRLLAEALAKVDNLEKTVSGLKKDNATAVSLKKEVAELKQIRQDLENQLASLGEQNKQKDKEIESLTAEVNTLKSKQNELNNTISDLKSNVTDDFRIESTKGKKNKLTLKANKTKKLNVSFEIPQSMSDNVKFDIVTPKGKTIKSEKDKTLSYRVIEDGRDLTASLSPYSGEFEISRRIEMIYSPENKLEPGIYKIKIYHKDLHVGSCQVKLK